MVGGDLYARRDVVLTVLVGFIIGIHAINRSAGHACFKAADEVAAEKIAPELTDFGGVGVHLVGVDGAGFKARDFECVEVFDLMCHGD